MTLAKAKTGTGKIMSDQIERQLVGYTITAITARTVNDESRKV